MAQKAGRTEPIILSVIYLLAAVLMIVRVDWWWWGKKILPLIGGWLTVPMIYQLGIWIAGTALVFWLCMGVWNKAEEE